MRRDGFINMSKLKEVVERYDSFVNECYDGGYASTSESAYIGELKNEVVKEARSSVKELNALEIIVRKRINMEEFCMDFTDGNFGGKNLTYEDYLKHYSSYGRGKMTEEEFNILVGVIPSTDAKRQ